MSDVALNYIRFSFAGSAGTPCHALPLRLYRDLELEPDSTWSDNHAGASPEWTKQMAPTASAESSPSAYALADIDGGSLSVKAGVTVDWASLGASSIELRAEPTLAHTDLIGPLAPVTISQGVAAGPVSADPDIAGAVQVTLDAAPGASEVGAFNIAWTWQYRTLGGTTGTWIDVEVTEHRVYITLDRPRAPWTDVAVDPHNPWVGALEWSCVTAAGADSADEVLRKLAKTIFDDMEWTYNTADINDGESRYASIITGSGHTKYQLDSWLWYGDDPADGYSDINCYDLAGGLLCCGSVLGVQVSGVQHHPFGFIHEVMLPAVPAAIACNNPMFGHGGSYSSSAVVPAHTTAGRGHFTWHCWTELAGKVYDPTVKFIFDSATVDKAKVAVVLIWLILLGLGAGESATEWLRRALDTIDGRALDLDKITHLDRLRDADSATGDPAEQAAKQAENNGTDQPWVVSELH